MTLRWPLTILYSFGPLHENASQVSDTGPLSLWFVDVPHCQHFLTYNLYSVNTVIPETLYIHSYIAPAGTPQAMFEVTFGMLVIPVIPEWGHSRLFLGKHVRPAPLKNHPNRVAP